MFQRKLLSRSFAPTPSPIITEALRSSSRHPASTFVSRRRILSRFAKNRRDGSSWRGHRDSCRWPHLSDLAPPFGILLTRSPPRPGGVLVGASHRAICAHRPLELPRGLGYALPARQPPLP